ncbi:hypothetical protein [Ornithinimicrobium sediminis]|uniref:hypothetical protein n=1 Tax=Ornithinimicrobium sediminis TaxID=2904603 RepID=UPI001E49754A|nr:hypothetical protein [Ornithinimicrobium sediminis]MCE0488126.1 hypothetical protein [Ornithinimicrobium sediminis]
MTLDELLDRALPLNRKERYYTGTVLPALLCAHSMCHLSRLGRSDLLDLGELDVRADPDDCTVLFFTEYSLIESAVGKAAELFPGMTALAKDTPDVVILVTEPEPVLIALEAKMFDRPSSPELLKQLAAQKAQLDGLCTHLARHLDVPRVRLAHWALLPRALADAMPDLETPVITWEQIRDAYADVDQHYFHGVLTTALRRYPELVSKWVGYQDGDLAGAKLVQRALAGDDTWPYMGAQGGVKGQRVTKSIAEGTWSTTVFQCRHKPLPGNNNWFAVADFITTLRAAGVDVDSLAPTASDEVSDQGSRTGVMDPQV